MNRAKVSNSEKRSFLRTFGLFSISLFLIIMLMGVFVVLPKLNDLLVSQHDEVIKTELALEAALFERFVENQRTVIQDLATSPSITNAVMLSDGNNRALHNLLDNIIISGQKGRVVLQDISGHVLFKTTHDLQGNYHNNPAWFEAILESRLPYHFRLLEQNGFLLNFKISVPIIYNGYVEGVLSSEIAVPLNDIFLSQAFNPHIAFKLIQDGVVIETRTDHINMIRETNLKLESLNILFIYITDYEPILARQRAQTSTVLSVLLFSFVLSFLLFIALGFWEISQREHKANKHLNIKIQEWKNYILPLLVAFIGISASVTAYQIIRNIQYTAVEDSLIAESKQKIIKIRKKIDSNLQVLDAVKAFFNSSQSVDRGEFKTFMASLLSNYDAIQTVKWLPQVSHDERAKLEREARLEGIQSFEFKDIDDEYKLVTAAFRETYFPVYYAEPLNADEQMLGFDFKSDDNYLNALIKSANSHQKTAIKQHETLQVNVDSQVVMIASPVYKDISTHTYKAPELLNDTQVTALKSDTSDVFAPNLLGFIVLEFDVKKLIVHQSSQVQGDLKLYIEDGTPVNLPVDLSSEPADVSSNSSPSLLSDLNSQSTNYLAPQTTIYGHAPSNPIYHYNENMTVADKTWHFKTYSTTAQKPQLLSAWFILIGGVILSIFISLGLAHLIRRRNLVEQLVATRTVELKASEEQHRAVVENAVDGLFTLNQAGIIERFNYAAEQIFNYSSQDIIGLNIQVIMPEFETGKQQYAVIKQKKGVIFAAQGKRKNDGLFPIELSLSEIDLGSTKKISGIVRDISGRIASEVEREKLIDKLTDSNEELERFAFVCSHDLQEPLRMIRSFSEKLQIHLAETIKQDAKGTKYFNFVIDGATRAQMLISDILAYSSINNNTQKLERVNIEDLINVIKQNVTNGVDSQDITDNHTPKITFDALPELQGNKTQLFQLFQNLINNGIKYQKSDTVPHVHISVKALDKHWLFTVKDNGIGMEARHLKKIFDVFQRLHRRSQYAGTGVGLSICKKVAERHGGRIWVESTKDVGSTFYVELSKTHDDIDTQR